MSKADVKSIGGKKKKGKKKKRKFLGVWGKKFSVYKRIYGNERETNSRYGRKWFIHFSMYE
jgi:hypothetical protein